MKSDLECLVCLLKQALNTVRIATTDESLRRRVLDLAAETVPRADLESPPAVISNRIYEIVAEVTGVKDPFLDLKRTSNRMALEMAPRIRAIVASSDDPLNAALHASVAGNIIDYGIGHAFNLEKDMTSLMTRDFAVDDRPSFQKELVPGTRLLFLGDNAGEIVFDRILVEALLDRGIDVTFSVKSAPIINDALMEDAEAAGLTDLVRVIETGSGDIGVNLDRAGDVFRKAFDEAGVILGKGHGNFETCSGMPKNLYFLLKAKCPVVARELGVALGDIVFKHQPGS